MAQGREGKSYGYQQPQETAAEPLQLEQEKDKFLAAFERLFDAVTARTSGATDGAATGQPASQPATGQPATGSPSSGTPSSGASTGPAKPSTGPSGTQPSSTGGEQATSETTQEAQERSLFAQREAFRLDRAKETARRLRAQETSIGPDGSAGAAGGKHRPDSNRAPRSETKRFEPAYGSAGKSAAPTIERIAAPLSKRPESAPAPGVVNLAKPIGAYWGSYGNAVERAMVRARVGTAVLESIIGTDDRVRVTNNQLYPWRCICSLLITSANGTQYLGTGWLVSPRLLLTAGHCVYMSDEGGWVSQIEVIPGRDAASRPFASAISRDFRSVTGWTQDNDSDCDYGAILLPEDKRYGEQLGWFGYASRPDDYLKGLTLNLSGYPGDGGKTGIDGTQWFHSRTVKDVLPKQLTYEIDTFGGQSGAPVWEMGADGSRYGVAIHTFGTSVNNGGTRITGEVFDNIVLWAGQAP